MQNKDVQGHLLELAWFVFVIGWFFVKQAVTEVYPELMQDAIKMLAGKKFTWHTATTMSHAMPRQQGGIQITGEMKRRDFDNTKLQNCIHDEI